MQWKQDDSDSVGNSSVGGPSHWLRWETLPRNRDLSRLPPLPEPTMLQVVTVQP